MLPSDHFVRMYNELFKMLMEQGEGRLEAYWLEISGLQETILGPFIDRAGLEGMREYWDRIRIEENCDADLSITDDYFEFRMNACPSLGKVLDSDATACPLYCDHCAGWIAPIMERRGYFLVYDMVSRTEPRCVMRVYRSRGPAEDFARRAGLLAGPSRYLAEPRS
ncbi:MAG: hypothetical protein WCL50_07065 [Spirochaetota bacterium]